MILGISLLVIISVLCVTIFSDNSINAESDYKAPIWVNLIGDWWLNETITDWEFFEFIVFLTEEEIIKGSQNETVEIRILNSDSILNSSRGEFTIHYMNIEDYGEGPYPGRISPPEPRGKDIEPEKIEVWLRQNQYFEKQITYLNEHMKLSNDIKIGLGECQEKKAFYNENTKMIVICYELIFDIYDKLKEEFKSKGFTEKEISKITLDVIDFIFYHQISHAIIETISNDKNIKILNHDEYFVDALSNHIKSLIQKDKKQYSVENIALWFKIMQETENLRTSHMWDIHLLNLERLSKIACQDSAFNSDTTINYIQKGILTEQDIIECKSELVEQRQKLEKISNQILK